MPRLLSSPKKVKLSSNSEKFIHSAIIKAGSIRKLASNLKVSESSIRSTLKGKSGEVAIRSLVNKTQSYAIGLLRKNDNDIDKIHKILKKKSLSDSRRLAVRREYYSFEDKKVKKISSKERLDALVKKDDKRKKKSKKRSLDEEELADIFINESGAYEII